MPFLQLLITLCVENRKFFSNFPGYNISQMINIVLNLVISCVKQYTELQIASNSSNEKEEEYDSDGGFLFIKAKQIYILFLGV